MSILEVRIFVNMLAQIYNDRKKIKDIRIPLSAFTKEKNISGQVYNELKVALDKIPSRVIKIEKINHDGKNVYSTFSLIPNADMVRGDSHIVASFNDKAEPYLIDLENNYTQSLIKYLENFRSYYSFRIYNLLRERADYKPNGKRVERVFTVEQLKDKLDIKNKYKKYIGFRTRVLDKAEEELRDTDLAFKYIPIKKGRSVHAIRFILKGDPEPIPVEKGMPLLFDKSTSTRSVKLSPSQKKTATTEPAYTQLYNYFTGREVRLIKDAYSEKQVVEILKSVRDDKSKNEYKRVEEYFHAIAPHI